MTLAGSLPPARRRWLLSVLLGLLLVGSSAHVVYRGTHTAAQPLEPASVEEGARCQLREVDGRKPVECALWVAQSADAVWRALTRYERGPLFDSWLGRYEITEVLREPGERTRLLGSIQMWLRSLPVDVTVEERTRGPERSVSWASAGPAFGVNRGSWSVVAVEPTVTLVRYTLDLEIPGAPSLVVRAILRDHLAAIVEAIVSPSVAHG